VIGSIAGDTDGTRQSLPGDPPALPHRQGLGVSAVQNAHPLLRALRGGDWPERFDYGPPPPPAFFLPFTVPATVETYLATAWIWAFDSELPNAGIPPPPLVT
jgi:hypothetical protein